ncbi:MAG TPA: hypothetical protein VLJ14_17880 [Ktedonobacterales bacterium]|nr:hypothetical protein [Ktedonobacterales bacterium]
MPTNVGEQVLDALLTLSYAVEIADDGMITATNGTQTLHGKAEHGAIEWADRSQTYHVIQQAYIVKLRQRIAAFPAPVPAHAGGSAGEA